MEPNENKNEFKKTGKIENNFQDPCKIIRL